MRLKKKNHENLTNIRSWASDAFLWFIFSPLEGGRIPVRQLFSTWKKEEQEKRNNPPCNAMRTDKIQ